jgi:hypothetical protein
MAKYLLLYHGGMSMPQSEAEQKQVLKAWENWYTKLGGALADPGNPFSPAAKKVSKNGAISDGSVGGSATGYTILAAGSLDEAAKMAQGCPILQSGGEISVFETFEIM